MQIEVGSPSSEAGRATLVSRARLLARLGIAWHVFEAAIAFGAGVAASSIARVAFGADSLVETLAGLIVIWRFADRRSESAGAEQRAQRLIGLSFFLVAGYVGVEALRTLVASQHPDASWIGIGLAAVTLVTMPALASAKATVGEARVLRDQERGAPESALRLSVSRIACRTGCQRAVWLVVGRPRGGIVDRRGRSS